MRFGSTALLFCSLCVTIIGSSQPGLAQLPREFGLRELGRILPDLAVQNVWRDRGSFEERDFTRDYPGLEQRVPVPSGTCPTPAPVPISRSEQTPVSTHVSERMRQARNKTDVAKAFFKTHQYADAEVRLNDVVKLAPDDTNAWQFRSLALFAQGKFDAAAADAYDGIKLGNTWTTTVLNSIYPSADRYHRQLERLVQQAAQKPSMSAHFLLGYHYLILNDLENGRLQLTKVLEFSPEEPVATQLIAAIDAKLAVANNAATPTTGPSDGR